MATLHITDRAQSFDSLVQEHCALSAPDKRAAICENIAKYNNRVPGSLILPNQPILIPDNPN